MTTPLTLTITREPFRTKWGPRWRYYTQGPDTITMPDGRVLPRRFDNSSLVTLRRVLREAYGKNVRIVAGWKLDES